MNLQVKSATGALVSCVLESREANGAEIDRDEAATTGGNLGLVIQQNPRIDGYYVLQCALPRGGTLVSYRYVEPSPTDRNN